MSEIILDTITGKSTATTITIGSTPVVSSSANSMTIRGEGTAQTSIQQGLAKAWLNYNQSTPATVDSFSISSVTDSTTGEYKINVSSVFANTGYSCAGLAKGEAATSLGRISEDHDNSRSTSQMPIITSRISDGAYRDFTSSSVNINGDLA